MSSVIRFFSGFSSDPTQQLVHHSIGRTFEFDTSKIENELGLKFSDVWPAMEQVVEMMIEHGVIKSVKKST